MHVKGKIAASGITEVVIAIAIIAACIGVAALVFARTIRVTTDFESVRLQTELQSALWKQMVLHQEVNVSELITVEQAEDPSNDSLSVFVFSGNNERILWQQHWLENE